MIQKSLKKNMLMSIILTSANFIFPLVTFSYVSRVLGPDGTGRVAFVQSFVTYFSYIAILGIPAYGLREVAKVRDDRIKMSRLVQELLMLNLASTFLSYILMTLAVVIVPKLYSERMLFIVMGASIFLNTIGLEWVYQAMEEYSYITVRSLVFKTISVVLTFLLIRTEDDVLFYGFTHVFTSSASYLQNFFHIRRYISFQKGQKYNFKRHMKPILTLFSASVIITIYTNFDVSMIGFIYSEYEVGLYNAALKIRWIVLSLSTAVTSVLIPRMAYYLKDADRGKAEDLLEKSLRVSMNLAIPVAVFILVFAKDILILVCGDQYIPAESTLRVMAVCIMPLVLTNLFGNQILIPSGNEKRYSQSVFVGLWINLVLNALMIPKLGAFGAALATLITECWNVAWMSGGAKDYRRMLVSRINFTTYIIPFAVATIVGILFARVHIDSVLIRVALSAIVFFGVNYGIIIIEKEPLVSQYLRAVLSHIGGFLNRR